MGWFLHTPFPSSEIYRGLPVREEVLRAVLKADLIGFHTYDYARHFVSACTRILGLEVGTQKEGKVSFALEMYKGLTYLSRLSNMPKAMPCFARR